MRWTEAEPWRALAVFVAPFPLGLLSPLAGAIASVTVAPFALFVVGWSQWWYMKRRTAALLLTLVVVVAVATGWIFGLDGGHVVSVLYSIGCIANVVALLSGYLWGARRQRQGWSPQHNTSP
jgi:hypothetical protein